MAVARAIWSQTLQPGQTALVRIDCDIRLSLASLDEKLVDEKRCSIKITQLDAEAEEDMTFVLANLIPGKIETQVLDLVISEQEDVMIEVTGKNTVHLSGNYILQETEPPFDDEYPSELDSDEEGLALEDVSSDVEINPADLMDEDSEDDEGRFEEVIEEVVVEDKKPKPAAAGAKRPAAEAASPAQAQPSKKKQKTNKAANGDAKPAAKPESKPATNGAQGEGKKNKKNKNKNKNKASLHSPLPALFFGYLLISLLPCLI